MTSAHLKDATGCKTRRGWLNRALDAERNSVLFRRLSMTADILDDRKRCEQLAIGWEALALRYRKEAEKVTG